MASANPIVLYDGVCGLCNRSVQFLLKHDKEGRFRFASLQSDFAEKVLGRHGLDPKDLDTVHVVLNYDQPDERVLQRSDAVLRAGRELGGFWSASSTVAGVVPRGLRDLVYRFVATNRYRMFGKYDACMLPDANQRSRFLDV
ncbi:MAG TPA: thiol-disulfide oxidoreductase DCC family protein [Pyrinomonadaceae bacterium]|nr:thiol-disulfide oxidoreductase DCC family protein [Pyrinomonadaceae bacterium]